MPFAIMAIASIAGGIMNFMSSQSAARKQESLARENARATEAEAQESARRQEKANMREEAASRARAAASGLTISGSISDFLEDQEQTNRENVAWTRKSGKSRANIQLGEGQLASDITRKQGISGAIGNLGSGLEWGQKAGWF